MSVKLVTSKPTGWKIFSELERLNKKMEIDHWRDWSLVDRFWLNTLMLMDHQCKEQIRKDGPVTEDKYERMVAAAHGMVDGFLAGRSTDDLSDVEVAQYNNLCQNMQDCLADERKRLEAELEMLKGTGETQH